MTGFVQNIINFWETYGEWLMETIIAALITGAATVAVAWIAYKIKLEKAADEHQQMLENDKNAGKKLTEIYHLQDKFFTAQSRIEQQQDKITESQLRVENTLAVDQKHKETMPEENKLIQLAKSVFDNNAALNEKLVQTETEKQKLLERNKELEITNEKLRKKIKNLERDKGPDVPGR